MRVYANKEEMMVELAGKSARDVVWSATPTPLLADGALDDAGLERLCSQHQRLGVSGLFLAGSCGEGPFLPNRQRAELVRKVRQLAGGTFHLAVQVSDTSPARVRENIAEAAESGADSVVIAAPWLVRFVNRDFARRFFLESLECACPVPKGIYVIAQPAETGMDCDFWREIAGHPQVAYLKDSSGSAEYRRAFVQVKARRPELALRTGCEFDVLSAMRDGYGGCLLGTAIFNGAMIARAIAALETGDEDAARAWQDRSNRLLYDLFRPDISAWMSGLKYALRAAGLFSTEFSHLAYPLADDDRRRIDAALQREREHIGLC
ncbi:MAG: dihydrodipicolinate synthase family protein [Rhodopirellula sp.]|nr:dihydrodipicolinate synthase family protein [Rhodopirellula sp.]